MLADGGSGFRIGWTPQLGQDESTDLKSEPSSFWFGAWLVVVAGLFLYFGASIKPLPFADENDPGPRAFPLVLSLFLLAGGCWQMIAAMATRRSHPVSKSTEPSSREALLVGGALLVYLFVVPWVGFLVPSAVLAALMAWRLGARKWAAGLTAIVLLLVIQLLFVRVFKVQLPQGVWGALI